MLENENNKLRLEIEELRKQLNKDEVKCPKANPAPNLKGDTLNFRHFSFDIFLKTYFLVTSDFINYTAELISLGTIL